MKLTLKLVTVLATVFVILMMNFLVILNSVKAANVTSLGKVDLTSSGNCGQLLKYKGTIVKTFYVEYSYNDKKYPAYCLNKDLEGVSDSLEYSVTPSKVISDVKLWRTIINGYPYKTLKQLGVESKKEAFTATKQAIYCCLYENEPEDYEAIGDAGERTLDALKTIVTNAEKSEETQTNSNVSVKTDSTEWLQAETKTNYVYKTYTFKSNASYVNYNVALKGEYPEGTIITNEAEKESSKFSSGEKFKVMIPITSLKDKGNILLNVETEVLTKPVIYGKSPKSTWQNYALTAYTYEETGCTYTDTYEPNETKIKLQKLDEDTKQPIANVEFNLLDANSQMLQTGLITDENGEITIENILPGTYYIEETKAPEGYELYSGLIKIELALNEEAIVTVNNKKTEITKNKIEKEVTVTGKKEIQEVEEKILPVTGM